MENWELEAKHKQLNIELMEIIADIDNLREEFRSLKKILNECLRIDKKIIEEYNLNLVINNLKEAKICLKNQMKSK